MFSLLLPCLNNSFCMLYIFHCPSKLLWRGLLCLSLCQGRENMIGMLRVLHHWFLSCNPSLAEETWCVRWEYWYNVFFFSRRFKREGQTQRYSIPKHPTPKKQIYGGRGAEGIIRKKWCVVVWRWANVSVGSKHSTDMRTLGCWMFWICCVKKRTWRAKRGSCLSCLMSLQLKECKIRMNQVTATATKEQTSAHNSDISSIVSRCCHERSTRICDVSCMMFCSMIGFRFSFIGGSTSHSSKGCSAGGEHCFDWHQTQRAEIPPVKARQIWHDFDTYFELAKMFEASIGILICCGWLWMLLNIAVYATFVTQMLCYRAARTWALPRPCLMMSRCDGKIGLSENVELIFGLCVLVRDTWKNIM